MKLLLFKENEVICNIMQPYTTYILLLYCIYIGSISIV